MKISKRTLENIIREELEKVILEQDIDADLKLKLGLLGAADPIKATRQGIGGALTALKKNPLTMRLAREASSIIKNKNVNIGNLILITQGLLALDKDPELLKDKNFMKKHKLFLKIGNFRGPGADSTTQKAAAAAAAAGHQIANRPNFWGLAIGARW